MSFNLNDWAGSFELSQDTLNALAEKGFKTHRTLSKLTSALIKQEFKKLPLAQFLLLEEACQSLQPTPTPATTTSASGTTASAVETHSGPQENGADKEPGTGSSLSVDDIDALLNQGSSVLGQENNCGKPNLFDPLQFNFSDTAKHPYRDIRDFISLVPTATTSSHDPASIQIGSQSFLLKDTKISWELLDVAQYMEGSLRILREMALHDKCSVGELLEYVNYLVKIATLGQCFQWRSVLKYDQEYRKAQAACGFKWGADNSYLMQLFLKPEQGPTSYKPAQSQAKKPANHKGAKFDPDSGMQICMKWNSEAGCNFKKCKFAHKCMACFSAAHPKHECNNSSDSNHDGKK